jgi:uncharacterized protein YuzE
VYEEEADVLTVFLKPRGKLSHAEEVGDMVLHVNQKGEPLFLEVLRASRVVPQMVQALAKREVVVT